MMLRLKNINVELLDLKRDKWGEKKLNLCDEQVLLSLIPTLSRGTSNYQEVEIWERNVRIAEKWVGIGVLLV